MWEQAQITQALQGNFLFQSLTEKQRHTLIECMELVEVNAGDVVIRQVKICGQICTCVVLCRGLSLCNHHVGLLIVSFCSNCSFDPECCSCREDGL